MTGDPGSTGLAEDRPALGGIRWSLLALVVSASGCSVALKPRSTECTIATVLAGAGCASLARASDALDDEAKRFTPGAGSANLYVVRPSLLGGRDLWAIEIDGKPAGVLAEHNFYLAEVPAGPHQLAVISGENRHAVTVDLTAGQNRVVEVVSRIGWTRSRAELRPMTFEEGKAAVLATRRVGPP